MSEGVPEVGLLYSVRFFLKTSLVLLGYQAKQRASHNMSDPSLRQSEQAEDIQLSILTKSRLAIKDRPEPFLRLPREIRDEIYRFLLSTKYTKHILHEAELVGPTCLSTDSAKC